MAPVSAFQSDPVAREDECEGALAFPANSAMFAAFEGAEEVLEAVEAPVEVFSCAAFALPCLLRGFFFLPAPDCASDFAVALAVALC